MIKRLLDRLGVTTPSALFEPRMPEVETAPQIGEVFAKARAAAVGADAQTAAARQLVIVTPGRLLMLQPCPPPGSMPESQVAAIQKLIPPHTKRAIAAIAYTELGALRKDLSKTVPFAGILMGFAYIGHAVWVFEGHASTLAEGCRDADVLLVDGGMVPHLQSDWYAVATSTMRRPEVYVHDRQTYNLKRWRPTT